MSSEGIDDLWQQVFHGSVQPSEPQGVTTLPPQYGTPAQPDSQQQAVSAAAPQRLNPGDAFVLLALKEDELTLVPVAEDIINLIPLED